MSVIMTVTTMLPISVTEGISLLQESLMWISVPVIGSNDGIFWQQFLTPLKKEPCVIFNIAPKSKIFVPMCSCKL